MTAANLPARARWGNDGKRDPVAVYVAPILRLKVSTTEQLMKYVNHRCAAVIDGFNALNDVVRRTRFMEPIDAAMARATALPFDRALIERVAQADSQDNVGREMLLECRSREAAIAAIRKSQATRAALLDFELSAAKQWQICL